MSDLAPIALFVYNRPEHTRRTLEALNENPEAPRSHLVIHCDGPRESETRSGLDRIEQVRKIVRQFPWKGPKEVVESPANLGLRESIRSGVNRILQAYEMVIVLEDDLVVSPSFLGYMNTSLDLYRNDHRVWHVAGYCPPISNRGIRNDTFFLPFMVCWGWGTWADRWCKARWNPNEILEEMDMTRRRKEFDIGTHGEFSGQLELNLAGKLSTWAIFWYATIFLARGSCLYPKHSLVENIGFDGSGTHCGVGSTSGLSQASRDAISVERCRVKTNWTAMRRLCRFYKYGINSSAVAIIRTKLGNTKHRLAKRFGLLNKLNEDQN